MKLKTFDIFDMLENISLEKRCEIIDEVRPHCLYMPEKSGMGICLMEQKEAVLSVIRKHADALGIKVRVQGNFVNLDKELIGQNVDWDDIWLGDYLINSDDFWKEVVHIVRSCEERLIEAEDFAFEWNCIKKEALKVFIEKYHEQQKRELEKQHQAMMDEWRKLKSVPLF